MNEKRVKWLMAAIIVLSVTQLLTVCSLFWLRSNRAVENLVVINDEFPERTARRFKLQRVIQQSELVIQAIERYQQDQGVYPPTVSALVPAYLATTPEIYIKHGATFTYLPESSSFTFLFSGTYGLDMFSAASFGAGTWTLRYCGPKSNCQVDICGGPNMQLYHTVPVNDQWLWIELTANNCGLSL